MSGNDDTKQPKTMAKYPATLVFLLLALVTCKKLETYEYVADTGTNINVTLKGVKRAAEKSTFLFCDVEIDHDRQRPILFSIGDMKAKVNGELSEAAHYDSYASVMPEPEELGKGKYLYHIYFVFSEAIEPTEIQEFELINFGVSRPP